VVRLVLGIKVRLVRLLSAVVRRVGGALVTPGRVGLGAIRGLESVMGIDPVQGFLRFTFLILM
jgi:hypothetical protein